jgi:Tol biopolymer transport system component
MSKRVTAAAFLALACAAAGAQEPRIPTFDQVIELRRAGGTAISPDGTMVLYTETETNWDDNAYETEIFLAPAAGGAPIQLTRAKKSSTSPAWSPDGKWIAFVSDRTDKRQLYLISPRGGEIR